MPKKTDKNKKQAKKTTGSVGVYIVTVVTSLFAFVCSTLFFISSITQDMGTFALIIGIIGMAVSGLAVFYVRKYPGWVRNFICVVMCFFTISFSLFCVITTFLPENLPEKDADVTIIVFGCHTNGYMPGRSLVTRLNRAVELNKEYKNAKFIVTGAQGENESVAEALAMEKYLIERGVVKERIYVEQNAEDTLQNLKYSEDIIRQNGFENDGIILLSNSYHVPRIKFAARNYVGGIYNGENIYSAGSLSKSVFYFIPDYLREYLAWGKLFGRIAIEKITGLAKEVN